MTCTVYHGANYLIAASGGIETQHLVVLTQRLPQVRWPGHHDLQRGAGRLGTIQALLTGSQTLHYIDSPQS